MDRVVREEELRISEDDEYDGVQRGRQTGKEEKEEEEASPTGRDDVTTTIRIMRHLPLPTMMRIFDDSLSSSSFFAGGRKKSPARLP